MNTIELTEEQRERIADYHKKFERLECILSVCRAFVEKNKEALAQIKTATMWGFDNSLDISAYAQDAKEIAKLFGADGWERHTNSSACGQIDWKKTVDGIQITIVRAEMIKPTIKKEVRFE